MNFPLHTIDNILRIDSEKIGSESYLISLDFKVLPFSPIRAFSVSSGKGSTRGNHAHKKCSQFFVPIFGKMVLKIKTPEIEKKINLHHSLKTGILVPPKYWCSIKFLTNNAILMVACDLNYNLNDYLSNEKKQKLKQSRTIFRTQDFQADFQLNSQDLLRMQRHLLHIQLYDQL